MARILVIDDEHNVRLMIRLALQHVGHSVVTAPDGSEGLEKFGTGAEWDVTLLDQRMPGLEGLEVLREMRRRDPDAKVIMITAFGTIDLAADAMRGGAADFLRKPFTAEMLRGSVQVVLQSEPPGEPRDHSSAAPVAFGLTTINGFRIEPQPGMATKTAGDMTHAFAIRRPGGERSNCTVLLPRSVLEQVKARTHREEMPGGDRFWQAICGEVLANFVWQHAEVPPGAVLRVDDLTTHLWRCVDAMVTDGFGPLSLDETGPAEV